MKAPYRLGNPLPDETWQAVRLRTIFDCCKWDVQSEDHCVMANFPLVIEEAEWNKLRAIAEALTSELIAAEHELLERPDLQIKLGLPRVLLEQFQQQDEPTPGVARVMRFDFHFTDAGWRISEVNADVPGGFIEASGFTRLVAAHYPGTVPPPDPAEAYARVLAERFGANAVIGMVHATAYSDDRQVMQFLAKSMAKNGLRTIFASPAHIRWDQGCATISSSFARCRLDAMVRFFPAEWLPVLPDKPQWSRFFARGHTPMSNPASAMLVQSKRFPLVWNDLSTSLPTWAACLPETICPSRVAVSLRNWVVKPTFGRVGEDIAISGVTPEDKLRLIHEAANHSPAEWVAQHQFAALPLSDGNANYYPGIGVFTIDGTVAGAYTRIARKPLIDDEAQDIALLIAGSGGPA